MALTRITKGVIKPNENYDTHNINSTGIITATKFVGQADISGGSIVGTAATFTGPVTIGGTLTYEDVTNIDSVGIITARDGLKVLGGGANVVGVTTITDDVVTTKDLLTLKGTSWADEEKVFTTYKRGSVHLGRFGVEADGAGQAGQLIFECGYSGSPVERVRINSLGRVGIGTINPVEVLHVLQRNNSAAEFRLENNEGYILLRSDNNLATYDAQQHIFRSRDGSDEYGKFDNDGRLGIGTNNIRTTSAATLEIGGVGGTPTPHLTLRRMNTVGNGNDLGIICFAGDGPGAVNGNRYGAQIYAAGTGTWTGSSYPADLIFRTTPSGATTPTEKLRITSGGRIGIGTDNPGSEIHIVADAPVLKVTPTNWQSGLRIDVLGLGNHASNGQLFRVQKDGTTKLQLNEDGDLVITGDDNAELKLKCGTSTGNNIIAFLNSAGTTKGNIFYDSDNNFMVFKTNGTASSNERLRITSGGDVGVGNNSPNCRLAVKDVAEHTAYNSVTPSVGDCMLQLYNNPPNETANDHATLQFGVNGGSHNRVNSISAVAESAGNRKMAFTFCTDEAGSRTEKLRITGDGKVGIGIAVPLGNLHIKEGDSGLSAAGSHQDTVFIENSANAGITIATPNTNTGYLTFADPEDDNIGQIIYRHGGSYANSMGFFANASERLRIGSDGTITLKNNSGMMMDLQSSAGTGSAWIEFSDTDGTRKGYFGYGSSSSEKFYWVQSKAADMAIYSNGSDRVIVHSDGRVTIGDGNETATAYGANLLVDGGSWSKITVVGSTTGGGTLAFSDGSGSGATRMAGFVQMDHNSTDNGPRLVMGQSDVTMLHLRSPGSNRGQLELYGNFNIESTPALEINDGGDARKVYMSNSSGDMAIWTRNASRVGGRLKMNESGYLYYHMQDPSNSANLHKTFQTATYQVASGSTNQSTTRTTQYIIAGGYGGDEGMYHGRTNFEVWANNNDHYQPVAFVPMGYNLDSTSFGGHWYGEVWINQGGSQKPSNFGGTNDAWSTMTAQIKWDSAHWNAKPQMSSVVHYVNVGQASIGRLFFSGTQAMWIGWFQPGHYAVQYRVNKGISTHSATSAGGSILVRHSSSFMTAASMAYSSRNTAFDSTIMYGGNGSHST